MIITNLRRTFRTGFINFWRNGSVSFAAVVIMTLVLSVVCFLILSRALFISTISQIQDKVDINVYFTLSAPESDIKALKTRIEKIPEVSLVTYSSAEEELAAFKERHKDDELTLQALSEIGQNPLGASLNIKAKDPAQYEGIAEFLDSQKSASDASIIDKINYNRNKVAIDTLSRIMSVSKKLGLTMAGIFIGVAILIVFNTIRLTIYMAREEISVMRLVGASTRYIKGPFIVEGVMYGIIGGILATALYLPVTYWAGPYTESIGIGINIFRYYLTNIILVGGALVLSGFVIGGLSSYLAIKKYLKV